MFESFGCFGLVIFTEVKAEKNGVAALILVRMLRNDVLEADCRYSRCVFGGGGGSPWCGSILFLQMLTCHAFQTKQCL